MKTENIKIELQQLKQKIEYIESILKPESILDGKIAIYVSNDREFKLLMEHYEGKGWSEHIKYDHPNFGKTHHIVEYCDGYLRIDESNIFATVQYKVIPFSDFAAEVGIKVPVFIMTSEDGVQLYSGMEMFGAEFSPALKTWSLNGFHLEGMPFILSDKNVNPPEGERFPYIEEPDHYKAFSTKESAEAWILEANKPKELECKLFGGKTANIHDDLIRVFDGNNTMNLKPSDLEDMLHAYQSLQQQSDKNKTTI